MAISLPTSLKQDRQPVKWVTAKAIDPQRARRFINRLDSLGFEFQVVTENRHLRILVPEQSLEEVLEWLGDLTHAPTPPSKPNTLNSRAMVGFLIALPLGLLFGSVFSNLVGIPSPISQTISGYCGFLAAIVVYGVLVSRSHCGPNRN